MIIGQGVTRREDHRLLTGQGRFIDDLEFKDPLHVAIVRSPHPHARIRSISIDAALAVAGVAGIYIAADLGTINQPWLQFPHSGLKPIPRTALPADKVRYVGEPVAVVVAADRYLAEDASELVEVDYEVLPGFGSCAVALAGEGEPLHSGAPDNVAAHITQTAGHPEEVLAKAPHRFQATLRTTRGGSHSIEGRGVAARYDETLGVITVWVGSQTPFLVRTQLALCFGEPEEKFRVIAPTDVGGGFGPKGGVYPEDIIVPWLARKLRRPVKWIEDRYEHFLSSSQEREQVHDVDVGFDDEGKILAVKDVFLHDSGAYASNLIVPIIAGTTVPGPYKISHLHIEFRAVLTSMVPTGPVRGAGRPEGVFVMERVMDEIAARLGLDPAEVRFRNFIQPGDFPHEVGLIFRDGSPLTYDSGDYPLLMQKVLDAIDYPGQRAEQVKLREAARCRGIGLSFAVEGAGIGPFEGARVRLDRRGKITLILSAPPQGQGHETVFAQICAETLGVRMDDIEVITGDTAQIPFGIGTFASRVVANAGPAVMQASAQLREKLCRAASVLLEADPLDLEITGGRVMVRGSDKGFALGDVAFIANQAPLGLNLPEGMEAGLEATSYFTPKRAGYSSIAMACVVDVDPETGKTDIVQLAVAHDCGTVINPLLVDGQIYGGVAHGIGNALYENPVFTPDGQPLTTSYLDYSLPTATDVPRMNLFHIETRSPLNPLGVKGAGESGTLVVPAAVASAVEDALRRFGVRIDSIPLISSRIADLIAEAQARVGAPGA